MNVNEIKAKAFDAIVTAYYSEKLCGAYVDALVNMVNAFERVDESKEPEKTVKAEAKPVKKKAVKAEPTSDKNKIDKGKIAALHKAGWTQGQIADELGVTTQTISYHLKKLEADKEGDK